MKRQSSSSPLLLIQMLVFSLLLASTSDAEAQPIELARGVNFGNMLDGPYEGAWGLLVEERFFDRVVEAGFDHVRLPISWTHHADSSLPYTIDEAFFSRVDDIVAQATSRGLKIVVNVHHYDELNDTPLTEWGRALAIWEQIAERYQDTPNDLVAFEILNEPHGTFSLYPELWEEFMDDALSIIRETNPERTVLVGPTNYNAIAALSGFNPPVDPNILVSVHYYNPFQFTHQGASWITPTPPLGVFWSPHNKIIGNGWQNWSWDTTVTPRVVGIQVEWKEGWAGFRVHSDSGTANAKEVVFTCSRAETIRVKAQRADGTGDEVIVNTKAGYHFYRVPISGTPSSPVTDVFFQNSTPNPRPMFTIRHLGMPANGSFNRMLVSGTSTILADMQMAADWGEANGYPVHLGEFGAFETGNITARTNWTRLVRAHAARVGLGWAYWEFGAGFGIYRPEKDKWRLGLLQALRPGFKPKSN